MDDDRPTTSATGDAGGAHEGAPRPLVDFSDLPGRLQTMAGALALLTLLACIVDGAINGLTFALMGRWAGIFIALALLGTAVVTGLHAAGGADRAARRGERLSSPDVGLAPRRRPGAGLMTQGLSDRGEADRADVDRTPAEVEQPDHGSGAAADPPADPDPDR